MTGARLEGRTALITGGSSGIGRAIALRFAQEGAHVAICDTTESPVWSGDEGLPTHLLIHKLGGSANFLQTDVCSVSAAYTGRLDIIVNNAAILTALPITETTPREWDRLMDVNLKGQFLVARAALTVMLRQDPVNEVRGRLINVGSQFGFVGPPGSFAYAVAKGGTVQMTRQLAADYGREGIVVNGVAPGKILTRAADETEAEKSDPTLSYSLARTPFPRLGRPEDVANAALFLASDECFFISGHNLLVDGGWTAS